MNNLKNNLGQSANLFDQVNESVKDALAKRENNSLELYENLYFYFMITTKNQASTVSATRRIIKHIVRVEVNCDFVYTKTSIVP